MHERRILRMQADTTIEQRIIEKIRRLFPE
jgi:hypothetical protein